MSVIQRIRDKGAWIVFGVIALALIAFILQDGVRRGGSMFSNNNALGKVNGEVIQRSDFEQKLEMYSKNGQDRDQIIGRLWDQEVFKIILEQQFDKLGISVGNKEQTEIIYGQNSPFRQYFTDQQTGYFDADKLRQWLSQIKKTKEARAQQEKDMAANLIKDAVFQAQQTKYQVLLQHALYAPKWMVEKTMADNNGVSSVSYVNVSYTTVPDASIKVSDDEIMAYARKHRKEFERDDETRSLAYISFDAGATASDSAATVNQLMALKGSFASATDIKNFFANNSTETPYYNGYISKNLIKHAYIDSIVKMGSGGVYGPYVDGNNFVLAKVIGVKQMPDSVKIRHILIATHQQDQQSGALMRVREDSSARKIMDTVEAEIRSGKNFDSVCSKYSEDPGSKDKGGVYDYFPSGRMVPEFNDFAFGNPVGSKGVVKTEFGYHYIEVLGQKGSSAAYKIAYLSKPIIVSNETDNAASSAASQFASASRNKKDFDANAAKLGKTATPSGDLKENDFDISGLNGSARQIIRWLYEHKVGTVADQVFRVGDKYVVPIVISVIKPGLPPAAILRPQIEVIVRNQKKAKQIIETKIKGNTLETIATSAGTAVQRADSVAFASPFVDKVGMEPKFAGASFNTTLKGKISEPIAGNSGVFVLRVENIGAKPNITNGDAIKSTIVQSQQTSVFRGTEALKKISNIKDYRSKFF